ncbi:hypothetical protein Dimus_035631 [Dionaea muscipula]
MIGFIPWLRFESSSEVSSFRPPGVEPQIAGFSFQNVLVTCFGSPWSPLPLAKRFIGFPCCPEGGNGVYFVGMVKRTELEPHGYYARRAVTLLHFTSSKDSIHRNEATTDKIVVEP